MVKDESFMKFGFYSSIVVTCIMAYFSLTTRPKGYYGLISVPFLIVLIIYFKKGHRKAQAINYIKREWSKKQKRKRNFKGISTYHKFIKELNKDEFHIDDQTWQDLTMDSVYETLDRTLSKPGEYVLYDMLRTPSFNEESLKKRNAMINLFKVNNDLRDRLQYTLYMLGREKGNGVINLLWGPEIKLMNSTFIFYIMSALALFSISTFFIFGVGMGVLSVTTMFLCNISIHAMVKKLVPQDVPSIGRVGDIIKSAQDIKTLADPALNEKIDKLKSLCNTCGYITKRTMSLGRIEGVDVLLDYINIFFLADEISYFSAIKGIKKYRKELRDMYTIIGELDVYVAIASYREETIEFVEPEFTYGDPEVEIIEGKHPLIEGAVANTIKLQRGGIILTGSNMSGKSTFLRMLGVNALLAQTIYTCNAKAYKGSLIKVMTSISPSDNIIGGKSYYLGEAEALLRIINETKDNVPSLCMIDEIFRGTNPLERVSAAAEILDYLPDHNAMIIAATHDIELTEMVKNHYECYYFTEDVGKEGLIFDYKLRKGISKTRNAIKVLKFLGYPDEIIDRANERIKI